MSDDKTQQENNLGWHFTRGDKLRDGRSVPAIGEVLRHEGPIEICRSGLHCSERLIDALRYAPGATLHQVRFGVDVLRESDKLVSRERVILRTLPQNETLLVLVEFEQWCARRAAWSAKRVAWEAAAGREAWAAAAWAAAEAREAAWAAAAAREAATAWAAEKETQNAKLTELVEAAFAKLEALK